MNTPRKVLTSVGPERDGWGRPKVVLPGAPPDSKKVAYTRCTTYVGGLEDTYKLGQWQMRHVAKGIAGHDDLIAAVRDADPEDRDGLNTLVDEAKERSGAGDSARLGTYLHAVTEAADRGQDPGDVALPWLSTGDMDPLAYVPDLAAYVAATEQLTALHIEQFCVQDPLRIGGTPDRVVRYKGKRYIADLKTGSIQWGALKIAAQLAVYARSTPYDPATDTRLEPHGAEVDRGIVIHLPAGTGECHLYWVDLLTGWEAVKTAQDVRAKRAIGFKKLMTELPSSTPPPAVTLADQIALAPTADAVRALWRAHADEWTDDLTALAKRHIDTLHETPTLNGVPA